MPASQVKLCAAKKPSSLRKRAPGARVENLEGDQPSRGDEGPRRGSSQGSGRVYGRTRRIQRHSVPRPCRCRPWSRRGPPRRPSAAGLLDTTAARARSAAGTCQRHTGPPTHGRARNAGVYNSMARGAWRVACGNRAARARCRGSLCYRLCHPDGQTAVLVLPWNGPLHAAVWSSALSAPCARPSA